MFGAIKMARLPFLSFQVCIGGLNTYLGGICVRALLLQAVTQPFQVPIHQLQVIT